MAAHLFLASLVLAGADERHLNRETLWSQSYGSASGGRALLARPFRCLDPIMDFRSFCLTGSVKWLWAKGLAQFRR